jgi:hypothetical protein
MKTTPKESPEVIEARQRVEGFRSQIESAREELERLRDAHCQAQKELSEALLKADEHLPQATLCETGWSGGGSVGQVVILRQTPTGQLVCRPVGSTVKAEIRFKISPYAYEDRFCSTEKRSYRGSRRYLTKVPEEYIKAARKQNT